MDVIDQIGEYFLTLPPAKAEEMRSLNSIVVGIAPGVKQWFLDGRNEEGRVVSNPNVGYGSRMIRYADGSSREFYQVGLSANTGGISVYLMRFEDKTYLARTYGDRLGRASVSGYCIKFKSLKDVDSAVLEEAIRDGFAE